ncbi:MAG: hypothetical protein V3T86_08235 [Planctomycetota bacterium]
MRAFVFVLIVTLAAPVLAQGKENKSKKNKSASNVIDDKELGVRFNGPKGWILKRSEDGGAWTTIATYDNPNPYDASVVLQVRNNIYNSFDRFKLALEAEFKESPAGATPEAGKRLLRGIEMEEAKMKHGARLTGFEVSANSVELTAEGKKREYRMIVRTFYGKHRLFRVVCRVRRVRYKKVTAEFEQALAGLRVELSTERVSMGTPLKSRSGGYTCLVPQGFSVELPTRKSSSDIALRSRHVDLIIYCYKTEGDSRAHLEDMVDYYEDDFKIEQEEVKVLGQTGFIGTITRGGKTSYVVGTVKRGRAVRVHAQWRKDNRAAAEKAVAALLKTFKVG